MTFKKSSNDYVVVLETNDKKIEQPVTSVEIHKEKGNKVTIEYSVIVLFDGRRWKVKWKKVLNVLMPSS